MSETTYYQRNGEVILNRAKDYYENNKELLRERAKNKCRELFEEEKNIKREYGKKKKMSEENKKRLKEYQKNYCEAKNVLHKCKYVNKNILQNCYCKYIFCSFFY